MEAMPLQRRRRVLTCLLAASMSLLATACGGAGSGSGSPQASGPCGSAVSTAAARPRLPGLTYANITATVVVDAGSAAAGRCLVLRPGSTTHLRLGDKVQFIARARPVLHQSGAAAVVRVTTSPARSAPGPGAPNGAPGLLVTLTAAAPGKASVQWFNCGGTTC
jgi:hypothetical protein